MLMMGMSNKYDERERVGKVAVVVSVMKTATVFHNRDVMRVTGLVKRCSEERELVV